MAQSARDELDFLSHQAALTEGDGPPMPMDNAQGPTDNWRRWQRTRETYLSLFGLDLLVKRSDPPGSLKPGDTIPRYQKVVRSEWTKSAENCNFIRSVLMARQTSMTI